MEQFEIIGGKKLKGAVTVNSSKNAAVALLMASLINKGKTTLKNVPQIEEVNRLVEVLKSIGVKISAKGRNLEITSPEKIEIGKINRTSAKKTRSIVLMIGALAGKLKNYTIPQCGGCRLGSRTVVPHFMALKNLGLIISTNSKGFRVNSKKLKPAEKIVLYETGDTATENALLAAAQAKGKTTIKLASANYMVQDLCFLLEKMGVKIKGIGTGTLEVYGMRNIKKDVVYKISEDPIEAMFFLSIAATCQANLKVKRCPIDFLDLELLKLSKMGLRYKIVRRYASGNGKTKLADIVTWPSKLVALEDKIHPLPSAGINIDNLPFFVPIACVARGKTLIHDWVYENRAIYFTELNKLGARVTLLDTHRVNIEGPAKLKGSKILCPPALRPAAIILVAMLAAKGKSILKGVYPINRGYENLEERLKKIGADIKFFSNNEK
ncbi:MAG: UDP-N-acetylglucosamine 1-carboxyvinyltransferase [Candidatus Moranbacteria bacterium]|nr:UDP-N-acetylglucosamine 1-carboxyvinyltransferase [Candidatus Moranbacteria bacterium]